MDVIFWGARGSIATPIDNEALSGRIKNILEIAAKMGLNKETKIDEFIDSLPWYLANTVGGETSCIEIQAGDTIIILDAGTGIRPLGLDIMKRPDRPKEYHIMISHTHWDHISGFPFFIPAFIPGNNVTFYGPHGMLEQRFRNQQKREYFPVQLDAMGADINFVQLGKHSKFQINDVEIETFPLYHPGGCFAYRVTHGGKSVVYATDGEYKDMSVKKLQPYINFFRDADLLIYDAQYTMIESIEREDWGHSTAPIGINIALDAGVKTLVLTHHEPTHTDEMLWDMFVDAQSFLHTQIGSSKLNLVGAYQGLKVEL